MDKYEYKVRSEEISNLIDKEKYAEAVKIADTIDWRRVKSAGMLLKIAALYRINRRNEDSRDLLMLAYERYPTNRSVVYSLCELSIELDDVVAAIEYYKQFAKLAPKDNGVYTLRYRILEAQEASLEERIEILEELKKRDYQEEWAYELAYLYHRVGLSTKCVEECDDIILWFGDGSYVMKAMELKALHVPLTEVQQKKYENMLAFSEGSYADSNNQDEDYQNQEYQDEAYETDYNQQSGYAQQPYGNESYDQSGYPEEQYDQSGYAEQSYENESYDQAAYTEESYGNEPYGQTGYTEETYGNEFYGQTGYAEETYGNESYDQTGYSEETYGNESYDQTGYVDDGYGNLSYVNSPYQDNSYTGEFYVEQTYDENGNPIDFTNYENNSAPQEVLTDDRYVPDDYTRADAYANGSHNNVSYAQQSNAPASMGAGDMSQYNTINLQKVVAESMKELFADDDDVFAEDRGKYNSAEDLGSTMGDTRIFANTNYSEAAKGKSGNAESEAEKPEQNLSARVETAGQTDVEQSGNGTKPQDTDVSEAKKPESSDVDASKAEPVKATDDEQDALEPEGTEPYSQTGKIAQMVTSVSEAAPEPHTGAIKKVLIPGEDARLIKAESDMDELRDITEKTVVEEQNRMEDNDENVYREQEMTDMELTDGILPNQGTGSMNLDDVLVEWERMKQDNAKKHQEEIKQHILTQTGKIFANFDNSIKSGILGELEREEAAAQKRNSNKFLEADDTGDIPQNEARPASEDDFEVTYITSDAPAGKAEKIEEAEPEKTEADAKEEYLSELERVVAQELGGMTNDIPHETVSQAVDGSQTADAFSEEDTPGQRTAEPDMPENNPSAEAYYTEEDAYISNGQTGEEDASYYEDGAYTPESGSEDAPYYEDDTYIPEDGVENMPYYEDNTYAPESGSEDTSYYEDDAYTPEDSPEDAPYYEDDTYIQEDNPENEPYYGESAYTPESSPESPAYYEDGTFVPEGSPESEKNDEEAAYTQKIETDNTDFRTMNPADYEKDTDEQDAGENESDSIEYYTDEEHAEDIGGTPDSIRDAQQNQYDHRELDPEDAESIAEMAKEDALKTQEIKMNTADLSTLSEKIVATTKKEAKGAKREEVREFTPEEQTLFENFAVTKKIKKQIVFALDNITLAAYTGNIIITGDAGLDTIRMAKNLVKEYQASDANFSGKLAKITGEKFNQRNVKDVFEKLNNGGIIIEKANGMSEEKLYEMALNLNQENLGIVVIMEDTKKEITKLLEKQAMIADYFNIRIDLMEMDNNALVAYAKNYALALEYSIDELGTLALYTRIANMQSGNHVVTKDEVRDIIDEAIWKSKKSKIKNFVDVLFARRYDNEDMIVLKERDFM